MNKNFKSDRAQDLMAYLDDENVELTNPIADYDEEDDEDEEEIAPATYAELMNKGPPIAGSAGEGKTAAEMLAEKLEAKV